MKTETADTKGYALITGAWSGMGREYARQLYALGHNLIVIDIDQPRADEVREELESRPDPFPGCRPDVFAIGADLAVTGAVESIIERVGERRVDILINNAGVLFYDDLVDTSRSEISRIMVLHNLTLVQLCQHFGCGMKERGDGYILNISSLCSWMPYPGLSLYSATKRFIKSFSRSLRIELMGSGVSVTTAYFGAVSTNLFPLDEARRRKAIRLGIMIPAEKAARKALRATFRRKANVMPGLINWMALPILPIVPKRLLHFFDKKYGSNFKFKNEA
ncbi:MAG: SDR family NAD(P)-dependent oxidoreductase [Bacteroidales bacterium]|nr:SDR family NAD(P)-dependent oxidoreductase [Bacteroidales bacterium]